MSEEKLNIFYELINGFEIVGTLTDDGKKLIKDGVQYLQQENQQLKEKIKTYEEPEDLTLIFMYCDEKAKDKIKQLQSVIKEIRECIEKYKQEWVENDEVQNDMNYLLQILDKGGNDGTNNNN